MIISFPVFEYDDVVAGRIEPKRLVQTLASHGFFYLSKVDALIPPSLFKQLKEMSKRFFALPLAEKMEHYIGSSDNHRGYVPVSEKGSYGDEPLRTYEAFDIGFDSARPHAAAAGGFRLTGPNRYPRQIAGMERMLRDYYDANLQISRRLLQILGGDLGIGTAFFEQRSRQPASQLRLIHYLPNDVQQASDDVSMGAHTDYEILTIMHQSAPGLMAYDRAAQGWRHMPVIKNTLLVLAGDMLDFLTNGHIKSLLHRVSATGEERYSFPFFMNFDFDTRLSVLPSYGVSDRSLVVGHHLLGQLYRDFPYIRSRIDSGQWPIDFEIPRSNVYEQQ